MRLILEICGSNTDGLRACRLLHCNIGYPSKIHLECKSVKILLAITSVSVAPLLWNFARCMAVSLPCTVQNFATMGQLRNKLGAIRFLWDLYPYIVTAPWCWDFMCRGNSIKHYYECSLIDRPLWKWQGQKPSGWLNSLRPRPNRRHFADDIFKCIFLKENVGIPTKISLKFVPKGPINNIPALVQIMDWRRPGDKPLSEPMMVSLLTHICVTRPQWVNPCSAQNLFQKVNEIHPRKSYHIMIRFSTRQSCPVVSKAWFNTIIFSTTVPKVKKRPDFNLTETVTIGNLQCCKVGE